MISLSPERFPRFLHPADIAPRARGAAGVGG